VNHKKTLLVLAGRVNLFEKTVKNGGVLQRLVEKKYSGEKKKGLLG